MKDHIYFYKRPNMGNKITFEKFESNLVGKPPEQLKQLAYAYYSEKIDLLVKTYDTHEKHKKLLDCVFDVISRGGGVDANSRLSRMENLREAFYDYTGDERPTDGATVKLGDSVEIAGLGKGKVAASCDCFPSGPVVYMEEKGKLSILDVRFTLIEPMGSSMYTLFDNGSYGQDAANGERPRWVSSISTADLYIHFGGSAEKWKAAMIDRYLRGEEIE